MGPGFAILDGMSQSVTILGAGLAGSEAALQLADRGVRVRLAADGLGPAGEFGWYGMSGSYALVDPVHELCFLYMQQMIPGRDKEIHPELRRCLYEDYFER